MEYFNSYPHKLRWFLNARGSNAFAINVNANG